MFLEGCLTCTALVKITYDWFNGSESAKLSGALLLDFSAVFDLKDHELVNKLRCYGFAICLSFLQDSVVFLNGSVQPLKSCLWDVTRPEPLSFSIFTNYFLLVTEKTYMVLLFIVYMLILCSFDCTICKLNSILSDNMNAVVEWVKMNKLILNLKL